jgi:hypothetical protein
MTLFIYEDKNTIYLEKMYDRDCQWEKLLEKLWFCRLIKVTLLRINLCNLEVHYLPLNLP